MEYEDFCPLTDLEHLNETLDKYGVAVLPNVLTDEQCEKCKSEVYEHLRTKLDVQTPDDYYDKLGAFEGGIINSHGVNLLKPILDVKTEDRVVEAFKKIWDVDEVTMSLDAIHIRPPPELTRVKRYFGNEEVGFHIDQASSKRNKVCVQSFIVLEPIEHGDACLSVLSNSHNYFAQFVDHFNINTYGSDWLVLRDNHVDWFREKGCLAKKIMAPKGCMVFWDSRTVHMGASPLKERPNLNRYRFIIYTCYTPAKWQTAKDRENLKLAYINNGSTTHWPYGVRMFKAGHGHKNDLNNIAPRHRKFLGLDNETN